MKIPIAFVATMPTGPKTKAKLAPMAPPKNGKATLAIFFVHFSSAGVLLITLSLFLAAFFL